jgi:hypothetical protein
VDDANVQVKGALTFREWQMTADIIATIEVKGRLEIVACHIVGRKGVNVGFEGTVEVVGSVIESASAGFTATH